MFYAISILTIIVKDGIFSPVAGIMGSLQANEVLKTILNNKNDLSSHLIVFNGLKSSIRKSKIQLTQSV